jgi:acetylornithine/N-succinyldiaminopimelate aminotransferase
MSQSASAQAAMASPHNSADLLQQAAQSVMFVVTRPDRVMVRGKGSYLFDADGRQYLDFIQGWAVNCLGHCPPALTRALSKQMKELCNGSPSLYNNQMLEAAKLLTDNSCLNKVWFGNSGAEVNEGAVKLARKYGQVKLNGAYEVLTTWNGFHGRTLAMMSASGKKPWDPLFEPKVPGFHRQPFNDLDAMKQAIVPGKTCAIMIEPVQGEAGVYVAEKSYMKGLRKLCDDNGLLLILDEIQTGIGRCGTLFAYEQYGVEPDIMTLGKGIGGGFPVAALLAKDHCAVFEAGDQGGTFGAQPLAMAAINGVVGEVIAKKIPAKALSRGRYLMRKLKGLKDEFGFTDVRGMGLLQAVDLPKEKAADVVADCLKNGLLINAPRPATLRFMPALNVSNAQVDEMVEILTGALRRNLVN